MKETKKKTTTDLTKRRLTKEQLEAIKGGVGTAKPAPIGNSVFYNGPAVQ